MPDWIVVRGEAASFVLVAVMLMLSIRPVARVLGAPARVIEEPFWWGGLLFVVVGRLAFVAAETPDLLLDVAVVVRFTDGLDPLAGAAAVLAWGAWQVLARGANALTWSAIGAGLTLASATYSLACPLREGCVGTTAPAPFGFPMHGLVEPRLATPVIEGILLLVVLAVAVRLAERWTAAMLGWGLLAALAAIRLLLTPLSASGGTVAAAGILAVATAASAVLLWRASHRGPALRRQPDSRDGAPG